MPVPGAAGIADGVLISTEKLNLMQLTNNNSIAQLGPGLRWGAVYDWISQYNLGIAGGRYDPVGVPGVLLGGGINFFGSQFGWSSNTVTNFEVVLANSSIVNANSQTNPDLFWALKGGSSNFGIVTRFDLKTFPVTSVYGGTTVYEPQSVKEYLDAIANYVVPGGGSDDIHASINPTLGVNVSTGTFTINSISSHLGADANPRAFENFTKIPANFSDNSVRPNFSAFTDETSSPVYSQRANRYHITLSIFLIPPNEKRGRHNNNSQMALRINSLESNPRSRLSNQQYLLLHSVLHARAQKRSRPPSRLHTANNYQDLAVRSEDFRRRRHRSGSCKRQLHR